MQYQEDHVSSIRRGLRSVTSECTVSEGLHSQCDRVCGVSRKSAESRMSH